MAKVMKLTVRSVILWLLVSAVMAKPTVFMPAMTTADIAKACPVEQRKETQGAVTSV